VVFANNPSIGGSAAALGFLLISRYFLQPPVTIAISNNEFMIIEYFFIIIFLEAYV
jgi:hypothetical protein